MKNYNLEEQLNGVKKKNSIVSNNDDQNKEHA